MTTATLLNGHLFIEGFYNCSHFMHTSANISTHNLISIPISKHLLQLTRRKKFVKQSHIGLLAHAIPDRKAHLNNMLQAYIYS